MGVPRNKKDTNESDSTEVDNEVYDVSNLGILILMVIHRHY
jgi:hypothetical protein